MHGMLDTIRRTKVYMGANRLIVRYREAQLGSKSAEIAYFLILAFFPFLFFLINLLSFTPLSNRLLLANFNAILPADTAALVKGLLTQTVQAKSTALLMLGMAGSMWAAAKGVSAIIRGLNHSYQVQETRSFFKLQAMALAVTIVVSAIVIFSFVLIVFGRIIGSYLFGLAGVKSLFYSIWPYFRYGISLLFLFLTYLGIYRFLPNRALPLRHLLPGSLFATVGWVGVSMLFAQYVNSFALYERVYGSLGGVFALIVWLDLTALILLLGGEINALCSEFADGQAAEREKPG